MNRTINRLWRTLFVTVFLLIAVGCEGKDVTSDPKAVDAITVDYIFGDLGADIMAVDSSITSVSRVKLTRQDDIPIAIVDVVRADGATDREFYGFNYQDVVRAVKIIDACPSIDNTTLAVRLNTSAIHATVLRAVACRAKGKK